MSLARGMFPKPPMLGTKVSNHGFARSGNEFDMSSRSWGGGEVCSFLGSIEAVTNAYDLSCDTHSNSARKRLMSVYVAPSRPLSISQ